MGSVHDFDEERRGDLAKTVIRILDAWGVEPAHQVVLLGLPDDTRPRKINQYRAGAPFPEEPDLLLRVHYLLSIHRAIETMYPHSPSTAIYWVTTPNAFFSDKTPVQIMLDHGAEGMKRLVDHLNGTGQW